MSNRFKSVAIERKSRDSVSHHNHFRQCFSNVSSYSWCIESHFKALNLHSGLFVSSRSNYNTDEGLIFAIASNEGKSTDWAKCRSIILMSEVNCNINSIVRNKNLCWLDWWLVDGWWWVELNVIQREIKNMKTISLSAICNSMHHLPSEMVKWNQTMIAWFPICKTD